MERARQQRQPHITKSLNKKDNLSLLITFLKKYHSMLHVIKNHIYNSNPLYDIFLDFRLYVCVCVCVFFYWGGGVQRIANSLIIFTMRSLLLSLWLRILASCKTRKNRASTKVCMEVGVGLHIWNHINTAKTNYKWHFRNIDCTIWTFKRLKPYKILHIKAS